MASLSILPTWFALPHNSGQDPVGVLFEPCLSGLEQASQAQGFPRLDVRA